MDQKEIIKIIEDIRADRDTDAIASFETFLSNIPDNSTYSNWSVSWIKEIYKFGALFASKNPEIYLNKLEKFCEENENKKQVAEFIYSEIIWNYFSQDKAYVRDQLKDLKKKYPLNPEFYHTYSHVLYLNGSFKESLSIIEQAIRIDPCDRFINTYINRVRFVFNNFISKNHIKSAEEILNKAISTFNSIPNKEQFTIYTNILPQLQDRLSDHEIIQEKISKIDGIISRKTESLRNSFVSMLGVFAAIISFILVTTNIAISNLNVKDIMLLMFAMANVLILFVLCIDYVFYIRKNKRTFFEFFQDKQFWGIIGLLLLLYSLFNLK